MNKVLGIIFRRGIGLLIYLILLGIANLISWSNPTFVQTIFFLNSSLGIIIFFTVFFLVGEIFNVLKFPWNIPGPIFNAIGALLMVTFFLSIFNLLGTVVDSTLATVFTELAPMASFVVFFIVLIVGYVKVFKSMPMKKNK
ncbi:MAG: hypothetical protein Q8Q35_01815 [Nanoarchaeota archaeon]|nr:hypothetical protein [Nanoarchaeota archaeon]